MIADVLAGGFAALKLDGSNPRDPAISRMLGLGAYTDSGVAVSATKVLGYPAVFRAVNIIGNGVAKCRPIIYKRNGEGKERATKHPAYRYITRRPNRWMSAGLFRKTLTAHALLWGNGIAHVDRNGAGRPIEYLPLLPDRTGMAIRGSNISPDSPIPADAEVMYWTMVGGQIRWILPENILHIRNLTFNGLWGFSVIEILKETFGLGLAAREYGAKFFGQGASPAGLIYMPPGMTDEISQNNFIAGIRAGSEGLGKSHRFMILEEGAKAEKWSASPADSQLLATREFEIREIAAAVGCQPHKLGDPTRKSYNSLEQSNQEHLDDDLDPWFGVWEESLEETALSERELEDDTHFVEFNRKALMRTNLAARSAHYASGRQWGYYSVNDIRGFENENPIGREGDVYLVPSNMVPADKLDQVFDQQQQAIPSDQVPGNGSEEPDDDTEVAKRRADYNALAMHECRRFVTRICKQAQAKSGDVRDYLEFLDAIPSQCIDPAPIRHILADIGSHLSDSLNVIVPPGETLSGVVGSQIETIAAAALSVAENLINPAQSEAA
jgi:HK97 family phage portal protein